MRSDTPHRQPNPQRMPLKHASLAENAPLVAATYTSVHNARKGNSVSNSTTETETPNVPHNHSNRLTLNHLV
jgi:hypothetical protein